MPVYSFQAKALGGKLVKGDIDASTDIEARVKLRAQQLIPIKISVKGAGTGKAKAGESKGFQLFNSTPKVKPKELQIFTRQLSTLITAGIPLVQSLEILAGSVASPGLGNALKKVRSEVESGKRFADAIEQHGSIFDTLYVNLVRAGEEGGVLDTILNRLATYIEKAVKIRNKISGAMWYPAAILAVAVLVISAIMIFVIPKFESLFTASGNELPWLTQQVVDMSHGFVKWWYLIFGGIFVTVGVFANYIKTKNGRIKFETFLIATPVFGDLIQKGAIARFSRTLSTMLSSGVSIIEALDISAKVCGNYVIETSLLSAKTSISEGKSITTPLVQNKYIPDMVVQMIGVGEQTGAMDVMLGKIADFYEEEVDYAVTALTSILEPLMMVFLGGIIALLVVSMYLPIFNLAAGAG